MNKAILIGRLTADPTVRYTQDSLAIANFTIAVDRPIRKDKEKEADFIRVKAFGKTAESCEKYLRKGFLTAVDGSIRTGKYENKEGETVYTTEVACEKIQFLQWPDQDGQAPERRGVPQEQIPDGFQMVDDDDVPY